MHFGLLPCVWGEQRAGMLWMEPQTLSLLPPALRCLGKGCRGDGDLVLLLPSSTLRPWAGLRRGQGLGSREDWISALMPDYTLMQDF